MNVAYTCAEDRKYKHFRFPTNYYSCDLGFYDFLTDIFTTFKITEKFATGKFTFFIILGK